PLAGPGGGGGRGFSSFGCNVPPAICASSVAYGTTAFGSSMTYITGPSTSTPYIRTGDLASSKIVTGIVRRSPVCDHLTSSGLSPLGDAIVNRARLGRPIGDSGRSCGSIDTSRIIVFASGAPGMSTENGWRGDGSTGLRSVQWVSSVRMRGSPGFGVPRLVDFSVPTQSFRLQVIGTAWPTSLSKFPMISSGVDPSS